MLKRLELIGFKSFSKKTALEFPRGITVIVGPNGSGKSNIIDAIRWLLGERETKNIRGGKIEDLIFSGTDKKARLGMAQASIHFDNSSKAFPVEFSEITVARKVYRDGVAEYLLNNSVVRLKDLIDFFAQSGLGTKGLSVVSQGSSDQFIKVSPKERREMMEEILGLRQYQIKKHDAELKLNNTKANLEKTEATINELSPRLRLLRRQVGKWEKRVVFVDELRSLENQYFSSKIQELNKLAKDIDPQVKNLDNQLSRQKAELEGLEKEIDKIENQQPKAGFNNNRRFELQRTLGRLEAQLKFSLLSQQNMGKNKITATAGEIVNLVENIQKQIKYAIKLSNLELIKQKLADIDKIIGELFAQNKEKGPDSNENKIKEDIKKLEEELIGLENQERETQTALEDFNKTFRGAFNALSDKRQLMQKLESQKNHLLLEKDRWQYRWQGLEDKIRQAGRKIGDFNNVNDNSLDFTFAEQRMIKLKGELAAIGEIDDELVKEAKETEERYEFLTSQLQDLQKGTADLAILINNLDQKIHTDFRNYLVLVNQHLAENFKVVFGSGKARLIADADSVQIDVSVPGKGIKDLESLSGGEKSLLAIAVLFSLIAVNPPPFIVLDEVDAALDEANSRRFAEMLKKSSDKTQFVVVTHNRAVMEAAAVLYGVTIDKDGVSKLLSLELTFSS